MERAGGRTLIVAAFVTLASTLLGGCARNCAIREAENGMYSMRQLDCSGATVKRTGDLCGDSWEIVEVNGCHDDRGEVVNVEMLIDTTSSRCFSRQLGGVCFE